MYKGTDKVLRLVCEKPMPTGEIAAGTGLNEDSVRRIAEALKAEGYVTIETSEELRGIPTKEFEGYARGVFPEVAVHRKALSGAAVSDLTPQERSIGIRWARAKGFVLIEGGKLVAAKAREDVEAAQKSMADAFAQISKGGKCADAVLFEELLERRLVDKKLIRSSMIAYTGKKIDWSLFQGGFDVSACLE